MPWKIERHHTEFLFDAKMNTAWQSAKIWNDFRARPAKTPNLNNGCKFIYFLHILHSGRAFDEFSSTNSKVSNMAKTARIFIPYGQLPHDVIVKAWQDEAFKARLLSNPNDAFIECGYNAPAKTTTVTVNTPEQASFVLPPTPSALAGASYDDMLKASIANTGDKATGTCS